jgi:hypothetical protein
MTRLKVALVTALAVCAVPAGVAEGSSRGAARERMFSSLVREWGPETESPEVQYHEEPCGCSDSERRVTVIQYREEYQDGSSEWYGAELRVSCHRNRCTGKLYVTDGHGTYVALVDHGYFKGRKGTWHESGWEPPS